MVDITSPRSLILASASPRRRELLARVGVEFTVRPAVTDETPVPGEGPIDFPRRLAAAKAESIQGEVAEAWVLGADTIVEIDGVILGKPSDAAEARAMVERLVGHTHRVITAFSLRGPAGYAVDRAVVTEVVMRRASSDEIADYVAAGEWQGKAGGYAVQGMAAALVREVRGSITNVIGLPLAEVIEELLVAGISAPRYHRGVSS